MAGMCLVEAFDGYRSYLGGVKAKDQGVGFCLSGVLTSLLFYLFFLSFFFSFLILVIIYVF